MTDTEKKPRAPIELPELGIDATELMVRIGRAKTTVAGARTYAEKILKCCEALDVLSKA